MRKFELVWRLVLDETLTKHKNRFTQGEIAKTLGISTSTVNNALARPRRLNCINVTGRNFELLDYEKLLLLFATFRELERDIVYETSTDLGVSEIEGLIPPKAIPAAYSAYKMEFKDTPADYDRVYIYHPEGEALSEIKKRFPKKAGYTNLAVISADPFLQNSGRYPSWAQTFADLWNLKDWYAKPFRDALLTKIRNKLGQ